MPNVSNDPEEAQIGKDLGFIEFIADDRVLNDYFEGLEIDAGWYDNQPYDFSVAPSMTVSSVDVIFPSGGFKNAFGNLWMRQQWTMNAPIIPRRPYEASSRVVDITSTATARSSTPRSPCGLPTATQWQLAITTRATC